MPKPQRGSSLGAIVLQEITHEKVVKDRDEECKTFLTTMATLGKQLGKRTAVVTLA
jgi:hypothetical protein